MIRNKSRFIACREKQIKGFQKAANATREKVPSHTKLKRKKKRDFCEYSVVISKKERRGNGKLEDMEDFVSSNHGKIFISVNYQRLINPVTHARKKNC